MLVVPFPVWGLLPLGNDTLDFQSVVREKIGEHLFPARVRQRRVQIGAGH